MVDVNHAVVGSVRLAKHRKTSGVLLPRESPAVDDDPSERGAMAAQEFGERMHNNVRPVIDRTQQDWGGNRVIDDQRNPVFVSDVGKRGNVTDVSRGIADAFAVNGSRPVIDELGNVSGAVRWGEADLDTLAWQDMTEQGVGGPIKLGNRNNIGAGDRKST